MVEECTAALAKQVPSSPCQNKPKTSNTRRAAGGGRTLRVLGGFEGHQQIGGNKRCGGGQTGEGAGRGGCFGGLEVGCLGL